MPPYKPRAHLTFVTSFLLSCSQVRDWFVSPRLAK
jgi:hypothetical protein